MQQFLFISTVGLANGKVQEVGTHDELMERKGIYYELCTRQTKESEAKEEAKKEPVVKIATKKKVITEGEDLSSDESESEFDKIKIKGPRKDRKVSVFSKAAMEYEKKHRKRPFKYESKLLKVQKPEFGWLAINCVCQALYGGSFPVVVTLQCNVYNIFAVLDQTEQMTYALTVRK